MSSDKIWDPPRPSSDEKAVSDQHIRIQELQQSVLSPQQQVKTLYEILAYHRLVLPKHGTQTPTTTPEPAAEQTAAEKEPAAKEKIVAEGEAMRKDTYSKTGQAVIRDKEDTSASNVALTSEQLWEQANKAASNMKGAGQLRSRKKKAQSRSGGDLARVFRKRKANPTDTYDKNRRQRRFDSKGGRDIGAVARTGGSQGFGSRQQQQQQHQQREQQGYSYSDEMQRRQLCIPKPSSGVFEDGASSVDVPSIEDTSRPSDPRQSQRQRQHHIRNPQIQRDEPRRSTTSTLSDKHNPGHKGISQATHYDSVTEVGGTNPAETQLEEKSPVFDQPGQQQEAYGSDVDLENNRYITKPWRSMDKSNDGNSFEFDTFDFNDQYD